MLKARHPLYSTEHDSFLIRFEYSVLISGFIISQNGNYFDVGGVRNNSWLMNRKTPALAKAGVVISVYSGDTAI